MTRRTSRWLHCYCALADCWNVFRSEYFGAADPPRKANTTAEYFNSEQLPTASVLKSARTNLAYARLAYEVALPDAHTVQRLVSAVQLEHDAHRVYRAAMTKALALQISGIVPNAFLK